LKSASLSKLFDNNPITVQMLGLCPLMAVSTTLINAFCLGLATLFVLICSNGLIASFARFIPNHLRIPVYVFIIASFVTLAQVFLSAYFIDLYETLGLFLALITTNCVILGRAESFASKSTVPSALKDGLLQGLGFLVIICIVGLLRETLGKGFLLALLPPGGFLVLGCLIALQRWATRS
jgi:electron transport complex protein RnfE